MENTDRMGGRQEWKQHGQGSSTYGQLGIGIVVEEERGILQDTVASLPLVPPRSKLVQEAEAVWRGDGGRSLLDAPRRDV